MSRHVSHVLTALAFTGLSFFPLLVRAEDSFPATDGCACGETSAQFSEEPQAAFHFTADRKAVTKNKTMTKKEPAHFVNDARGKFKAANLKAGTNIIDRDEAGFQLAVVATAGKQLKFMVLDRDGRPLTNNNSKQTMEKGKKTTCWQCGTDASGDTHCWVVPCPDITGPWVPKAVMVRQ